MCMYVCVHLYNVPRTYIYVSIYISSVTHLFTRAHTQTHKHTHTHTHTQVADNLYTFLQAFYAEHPELLEGGLYVMGER